MKLIADSGSTKTDWCLLESGGDCHRFSTQGINPCHQSEEEIAA
ncbi:MAG: ATPase, partial [Prevotella sp.]|nr:ATPase [Prevotella sp.]